MASQRPMRASDRTLGRPQGPGVRSLVARAVFWWFAVMYGMLVLGMTAHASDGCVTHSYLFSDPSPDVWASGIPSGSYITNAHTSTGTAWDGGTANVTASWTYGNISATYVGSTGSIWEASGGTLQDGDLSFAYDGAPTTGGTEFQICYVGPTVVTAGGGGDPDLAVVSEQIHGLSAFLFVGASLIVLPLWVTMGLTWWRRG